MYSSIGLGLFSMLNEILPWVEQPTNPNTILAGDFNQKIDQLKDPTAAGYQKFYIESAYPVNPVR